MVLNKCVAKGLGQKIAAVALGAALAVTMAGVPAGTAFASSSSSSSVTKTKVTKKASKKTSSKKKSSSSSKVVEVASTSMKSASDQTSVLYVRAAEGILMEGPEYGEKAAKVAKKYLGYSYVYGGASPSTGFDCSGFTQYVYKVVGIDIWRTAQDQYNFCKKLKNKVKKSDIEVGDLLFFGSSTSSITHVGIYVGNGKYIHASTPSSGVKTSKLAKRTNWVAAGRPYEE